MSVEEKFKTACDRIRKFSQRPPDADMLEIYALYKQATVGDINTSKPMTTAEAKAKWEAWSGKKGLGSQSAKEQYVSKVNSLAAKYA